MTYVSPGFAEAYGPFSVWPSVYLNGTITKFTSKNQNTGVLSHIQDQAYTLGYVSYSLAYLNSWTQIGLMKNRAGKVILALVLCTKESTDRECRPFEHYFF